MVLLRSSTFYVADPVSSWRGQDIIQGTDIAKRLEMDPTAGDVTVDMFVQKIMEQCTTVLRQHENVSNDEYHAHGSFRTLEMEMVDVKVLRTRGSLWRILRRNAQNMMTDRNAQNMMTDTELCT
jgi:hypothetical protein